MAFVVTTSIAVAAILLGRWVGRLLFGMPVEQMEPPRLCWVCAYESGDADPCPECGTPRATAHPRGVFEHSIWRFVQRAAVPMLVMAALSWCVYAAWRVQRDYLPTRSFVERFSAEQGWLPAYSYIDHIYGAKPNGLGGRFFNSTGRTQDLGTTPDG